jgi:hypothetical protein
LADTNVISGWMAADQPVMRWLLARRQEVAVSTVTLAEVRRGIEIRPTGKFRRQLERQFRYVMEEFSGCIWVFDEAAAFEWGRLMAEAQARGHPLPFDDSLIAAIARSMGAKVVTRDHQGFLGCARIDPWSELEYSAW